MTYLLTDLTNCHDHRITQSEHSRQPEKVQDRAIGVDEADQNEDLEVFKPLLASIHTERIPSFASSIRAVEETTRDQLKCTVLNPPLYGSYHALFPIQFQDGQKWLLKVPATGHPGRFDDIGARSLVSEAQLMQRLKQETTIPIPHVFRYDSTFDNELNCPYILIERINGLPLSEVWFDPNISQDVLEMNRRIALKDIAAAMAQLDKYTFTSGGQLLFTEGSKSGVIGPMKQRDAWAELARHETDTTDLTGIFCEIGPFTNSKDFFLVMLDRRQVNPESDQYSVGLNKLLRMFIDWAPLNTDKIDSFVLSHPDFDIQNFLVSPDGRLCGIIDWDGIAAVPRCIGNRSLPGWLTRDWDPAIYYWGMKGDNIKENSPQELAYYRDIYVETITGYHGGDPRLTQNTLVLENLYIAATDPQCQHGIVDKIFNEIARLVAPATINEDQSIQGEDIASPEEEDDEGVYREGSSLEPEATSETKIPNGPISDREDETEDDVDGQKISGLEGSTNGEGEEEEEEGDDDDEDEEDEVEDDETEDPSSGFYLYEVATALATGSLDDSRLQILKEGFLGLFK